MTTNKHRLLSSLIALMAVMEVNGQVAPEVPRLVVNVVIDQLRSDYLQAFMPLYGEDGFARLMAEGRVYSHAEYPFLKPDRASAVASLMTGTAPYEHGIVAQRWLDRQTLQPVFCVDDKQYNGIQTQEQSSADQLRVSTIGDELKVSTDGKALVYAVAPYRDAAVLSAGHAADGGFWLNDETGCWSTSTYYGAAPAWLSYYDNSRRLAGEIGSMQWTPVSELVGQYNYFVSGGRHKPFRHTFKGERAMRKFKASALVNEEVTRFAQHVLGNTMLGNDAISDLLSVTYYAGNVDHQTVAEAPMELQDTYVRLDQQLASLISAVEQKVGKDRVLFVVSGTGYADTDREGGDLSKYRIPSGEFNITRAQMLLNMYLTAVYGQGQFVETSSGNQIYLNLKLVEKKAINLNELLDRSAAFLSQLSGVRDVYTSQRLMQGTGGSYAERLRNGYNANRSGDIIILVSSGWHLVNENTAERYLQRESYLGFPLIFLGLGVEKQIVNIPVGMERVAPTLSAHMRIRAPNACAASPLTLTNN